jgi:hypothetical protein
MNLGYSSIPRRNLEYAIILIIEYLRVQVFLLFRRILDIRLTYTSTLTVSQNNCICQYTATPHHLEWQIFFGFSEKLAAVLKLYIDQGSASICTFYCPLFLDCFGAKLWNSFVRNVGEYLPIDTASLPRRITFSEYHAWIFRWLSTDL